MYVRRDKEDNVSRLSRVLFHVSDGLEPLADLAGTGRR